MKQLPKYLILSIFHLTIFLSYNLYPQQLSQMSVVGKAELQSSELIAKEVRDANGDVCAGLIIATDLDDLKFDSYNGVVKMNADKPGRYFLFLSQEERVVTVYKTGYEPLKLILSEYGISKMESGKVWQIKVTGERKMDFIPVTILINPENAALYIDGQKGDNSKSQKMSIGKHELRIEKEGYKTENMIIEVSLNSALFNINLKEVDLLPVQIHSQPDGAKIFVNNIDKGETNKGLYLYAGIYQLKLSKAGYTDIEQSFTIKEDSANVFSYTFEKNAGTLIISVIPEDAQIFINKEDYTGKKTVDLSPGKYKIEIREDGYTSQSEMIDLIKNVTVTRSYSLEPKTGSLQFSVKPLDAEVTLRRGDKIYDRWTGMKLFKKIPIGQYELSCTAQGYETTTKSINIDENYPNTVDLVMNKQVTQIKREDKSVRSRTQLISVENQIVRSDLSNILEIGGRLSMPSEDKGLGYGGFINYQYSLGDGLIIQGSYSYTSVKSKDFDVNYSFNSFFAGLKYISIHDFYASIDLGYSYISHSGGYSGYNSFYGSYSFDMSGSESSVFLSPSIGFIFNNIDVSARYEIIKTYTLITIGVGYQFNL